MPEISIDINCDIGETGILKSSGQLELLEFISSCNIATGFHAGDPYTAYRIIQKAREKNISIGAHPAYPDPANFGRKSMKMGREELFASLVYQLSAISGLCSSANATLHHLKLHGALYHDAHHREDIADVIIRFLKNWPVRMTLYGQANSILAQMAHEYGIEFVPEAFPDRRYGDHGNLLPRDVQDAVIEQPSSVIAQALGIIQNQEVTTVSGQLLAIDARTLCIHGDHPNSIDLARELTTSLRQMGIVIKPPRV